MRFEPPSETAFVTAFEERIPVQIVEHRQTRRGEHTLPGSTQQWAEDTDEQPEGVRIDLRTDGRLLAGFRNVFWVRVTDPEGRPRAGAVEVELVSGELGGKVGNPDAPLAYASGSLDSSGLFRFTGDLTSEVIRLEVVLPNACD